ncbi:MAG: hypothetical protein M1816_007896 [Peltula sp. TS41687]|nr:MAG: hypothetical protein M1816_007896 [Peltula sp. TS41687]
MLSGRVGGVSSRPSLCISCAFLTDARRNLIRRRTRVDQRYVHASRSLAEPAEAAATAVQPDYAEEVPPVGPSPGLAESPAWARPAVLGVTLTEDEERQKRLLRERALAEEKWRVEAAAKFKIRFHYVDSTEAASPVRKTYHFRLPILSRRVDPLFPDRPTTPRAEDPMPLNREQDRLTEQATTIPPRSEDEMPSNGGQDRSTGQATTMLLRGEDEMPSSLEQDGSIGYETTIPRGEDWESSSREQERALGHDKAIPRDEDPMPASREPHSSIGLESDVEQPPQGFNITYQWAPPKPIVPVFPGATRRGEKFKTTFFFRPNSEQDVTYPWKYPRKYPRKYPQKYPQKLDGRTEIPTLNITKVLKTYQRNFNIMEQQQSEHVSRNSEETVRPSNSISRKETSRRITHYKLRRRRALVARPYIVSTSPRAEGRRRKVEELDGLIAHTAYLRDLPDFIEDSVEQPEVDHGVGVFLEEEEAEHMHQANFDINTLEALGQIIKWDFMILLAVERPLQVRRLHEVRNEIIVQPDKDQVKEGPPEKAIQPPEHLQLRTFRPTQAIPGPEVFRRVRLEESEDNMDYLDLSPPTRSNATFMTYRPLAIQQAKPYPSVKKQAKMDDEDEFQRERRGKGHKKGGRRQQKYDEDDFEMEMTPQERREQRRKQRKLEKAAQKEAATPPTPIVIPEFVSVVSLASSLKVRIEDFMKKMGRLGFENMNQEHILDAETAGLIATEYNFEPILEKEKHAENDLYALHEPNDKANHPTRPPVITIMGHVDHGKTTLLDYMRKSSVAASEHGGITQHIGAFSVPLPSGKVLTFLDTPGHEAFLSMRQRGANVTDIVVLVVAADDSVKPQTIEAIKHAKAAKVPMIVAINKIDKSEANAERVKQDLARHGVEVEDFGGDTQVICVSGKTGQGMEELEEAILTLSEILDVRADPAGPQCEGWILETTTKRAGRVATVLVKRGTFRTGQVIVAGSTWAKIRTLRNEAGNKINSAGPGMPVEVDGWKDQPNAGDEVIQAPTEAKAKSVVAFRIERADKIKMAADVEALNESRQEKKEETDEIEEDDKPTEVLFVLKADVHGSAEAITSTLQNYGNDKVRARILRSGVGSVTEFDIDQAAAAKGHILAFNIPVEASILRLAASQGVQILEHTIIYHLTDDVRNKLAEKLPPIITQHVTGEAEIGQVFAITVKAADGGKKERNIAGCKVRNGVINRNSKVRVVRQGETIYDGILTSLKHVKKDVSEMRKGAECGIGFAQDWDQFQVGDMIVCYEEKKEKRFL